MFLIPCFDTFSLPLPSLKFTKCCFPFWDKSRLSSLFSSFKGYAPLREEKRADRKTSLVNDYLPFFHLHLWLMCGVMFPAPTRLVPVSHCAFYHHRSHPPASPCSPLPPPNTFPHTPLAPEPRGEDITPTCMQHSDAAATEGQQHGCSKSCRGEKLSAQTTSVWGAIRRKRRRRRRSRAVF